jgi:uncharacterized surface protein with fasciclin (FAS1) repeats
MQRKVIVSLALVLLLALGLFSAAFAEEYQPNIVDSAAADGRFQTLHTAIVAAGLADTLASADNTFTVFAPTDAAFAALGDDVISSLLADPQGALTDVLLYHVLSGAYGSSDVLASETLPTLAGGSLAVSLRDGKPYVNDSQIIITDIQAKNGIIHVIDAVLVPGAAAPAPAAVEEMAEEPMVEEAAVVEDMAAPEAAVEESAATGQTIAEIAVANGNFNTLVAALSAAGLVDTFAQPGNYTVFAPTDDAFAAIPESTLNELLADPSGALTQILLYHVVGNPLSRDQLATTDRMWTLQGSPLEVNRDGSTILDIGGAKVLIYDIQASNGTIHVIDSVLLP